MSDDKKSKLPAPLRRGIDFLKKRKVEIGTGASGAGVLTGSAAKSLGIRVVAHSCGRLILSGKAGYVAGTLGTPAVVVGVATSTPFLAGAGVLTIVGGTYLYLKNRSPQENTED